MLINFLYGAFRLSSLDIFILCHQDNSWICIYKFINGMLFYLIVIEFYP